MRSLFSFRLPLHTTTLAATVSYSNRPNVARNEPSPASCTHAPPAPLPSVAFRRPPAPRSRAYLDPAHSPLSPVPKAPAMPRPHPRLTPPPVPIAPHHLSTTPLLPAPPRPHRAHRAPTSAPPPPSLSSRCGGPRALAGKNRAVCIPFSPNARKRPPSWQHPPEMHAFRDQDGNILAPCIRFRAQSGDSGCMARESCRQGPLSASRSPKSRMARRCCQRRPAFPRQRHAVRRNGLCAMRQRPAACGPAGRALRPAARAWPACRMPPCHLARVHRRRLTRVVLRRPHCVHRA